MIQFDIRYDSEAKTGMIEAIGEKTTQRLILESIELSAAFPMVMIEHEHKWRIEARLPEDVKKRDHFELYIGDKNFREHDYIDLTQEKSKTLEDCDPLSTDSIFLVLFLLRIFRRNNRTVPLQMSQSGFGNFLSISFSSSSTLSSAFIIN